MVLLSRENARRVRNLSPHVGWSFGQSIASRGIGLVTFLYVASQVDLKALGIISLVTAIIGVAQTSFLLPVVPTVIRSKAPLREKDIKRFTHGVSAVLVSVVLVGSLGYGLLADGSTATSWMLVIASLLLVASSFSVPREALLKRAMRIAEFSSRATLANFGAAIASIALAYVGQPVAALLLQATLAASIQFILIRRLEIVEPSGESLASFPHKDYSNIAIGATSWSASLRLDQFVIAAILGPVLLGVYAVAYRLIYAMVDVCAAAVGPVILSLASRRESSQIDHTYRLTQVSVALVGTIGLIALTVVAPWTIDSMGFGGAGAEIKRTILYLMPFGLAAMVGASGNQVLTGAGDSRMVKRMHVLRLGAGGILVPVGASAGDLAGCCLAILGTELVTWAYRHRCLGVITGRSQFVFGLLDVGLLLGGGAIALTSGFAFLV